MWSDSTIVLGWLRMSPSLLKTFVQNRVVEINELTGDLQWLHVSGKPNPADLLSRGLALDALQASSIWWYGPQFLNEFKMNFITDSCNLEDHSELPELKSQTTILIGQTDIDVGLFQRYSSYNKLRRVTAYAIRFCNNARKFNKRYFGPLSVEELTNSVKKLIRLSQMQSFTYEYNNLSNNLPFKPTRSLSGLNIFLDMDGIIRIRGRIQYSKEFSYDKKHPALLCSKHIFTRLLFHHLHVRLLHAGPQSLLATIRESWWPLRGRDLARQTVQNCVVCTRTKGKTLAVKMGNLPHERLEPGFPFLRCGVDYGGPMFVLNRKGRVAKLENCYVCLFVCFATRAVHLELVTSLTTEAYILALQVYLSSW